MDRNSRLEEKLLNYLDEFNINEKDFSKGNLYHQLFIIEEYFQEVTKKQVHYLGILRESKKLNINKISKQTNIPRSSIYNNPNILLYYINKRIKLINDQDITMLESLNTKNSRIKLLENINNELKQQVVDTYEMKLYINELEKELNIQYERREKIINEINDLKEQLRTVKFELGKYTKNKVINLYKEK